MCGGAAAATGTVTTLSVAAMIYLSATGLTNDYLIAEMYQQFPLFQQQIQEFNLMEQWNFKCARHTEFIRRIVCVFFGVRFCC